MANLHKYFTHLLTAILLAAALPANARTGSTGYLIRGIVRDSITGESIPFASVTASRHGASTLADAGGIFEITAPDTVSSLTVWSQGYVRKRVPIHKNRINMYDIHLSPDVRTLDEVVVTRKKYSKKNNPAVDLMQKIRSMSRANDPAEHPYYNYDKYERITLGLNDFRAEESNRLMRMFPFLDEYVDTSEVSGKPILNLSLKETSSQVHLRKKPSSHREIVTGLKSDGIDEIADQESMRAFLQDVLREIDLYDRDINLLQNRFVSPLSPLAADFYKFYITDTVTIDNERCVSLSFYPHNKSAFGFVGNMYVVPSDTAMFIRRVTMRVPSEINLNFIDNLYINQEFRRAPDGSRLKTRDDLTLELSVLSGKSGLYIRRNVGYAGHNFERPADEDAIFSTPAPLMVDRDAETRDTLFWEGVRLIPIPRSEAAMPSLMQRMRSKKVFYWFEKIVKTMSTGYIATGDKSPFDIGPLNTFISANTLEGLRLRVGGMTTTNLSKHWFSRFYGAYGFRDHKWKYGIELEYSFNEPRYHSREFPRHSIMLNSSYDVDRPGQHYLFTNADNIFLALKRRSDDRVSYLRYNALKYILELRNNFSVGATVANEQQQSSRLMQFAVSGTGNTLQHFNQTYAEVTLRYAPGEKFYQTRSYRFPINMDAPVVTLTHRYGPGDKRWSRWSVNRTELSVQKRFWFSAWGYLDAMVSGGHVWSKNTPFTQLFIPNANLSYTIQPESFALMNPMEFVADTYGAWYITYWANGAIFNYIPLLKRLKLREVFSCSGYMGNLSDRNNPALHTDALAFPSSEINAVSIRRTPYIEASAGIDNIFKCLRVDYVWRLTHRRPPYPIDHFGLRIALHVTF